MKTFNETRNLFCLVRSDHDEKLMAYLLNDDMTENLCTFLKKFILDLK